MEAKEAKSFCRVTFWATLLIVIAMIVYFQFLGNGRFFISEGETQRAITSDYMSREGYGLLDSITPVMGYPWPFPFEFPLFQFLAAKLTVPALSLALTGKIVSFLFFLGACLLLFGILRKIGIPAGESHLFLALLVSAPIYVSYSFSFTIETTAFFFFLLYLSGFISFVQNGKTRDYLIAAAGGMLAAAVKITTWAIGGGVVLLTSAWLVSRSMKARDFSWKKTCGLLSLAVIPLACGGLWTFMADQVKLNNPYGAMATSAALRHWMIGDMAMRLSPLHWLHFLGRSSVGAFGVLGMLVLPWMAYRIFRTGKYRGQGPWLALCILAFFLGPLAFTNVYFVHDYYFIPTGIFLIWGLFILAPAGGKKSVFWLLIASNLITSFFYLQLKQLNYQNPVNEHIIQTIAALPLPSTLIVFGAYFDSWIPYYSRKKALQTLNADFSDPVFQKALRNMKGQNVGAVIAKTTKYADIAAKTALSLGMDASYSASPEITFHFHSQDRERLRLQPLRIREKVSREIAGRLRPLNGQGNRLVVYLDKHSWLSVILTWNDSLYFFDLKNGFTVYSQKRFQLPPREFQLAMPEAAGRSD